MKKETKKPQIAIYQSLGDEQKISVRIEDENVWLTQKLIAELFDVSVPTVNEHLKNIFESDELEENSVIRNFRIAATDGKEQEGELDKNSTCVKIARAQTEGQRQVNRKEKIMIYLNEDTLVHLVR